MAARTLSLLAALSLAALVVPAAVTAAPAQAATCPAAIVLGLHGVGEPANSGQSNTIAATFAEFRADATAAHVASSSYNLDPINYPKVNVRDFFSLSVLNSVAVTTVKNTAITLDKSVQAVHTACPAAKIELAGYSLGAWIIQAALQDVTLWSIVSAAEYYGDPCWYNPSGGYIGLVRFTPNQGENLGCTLEGAYPYEDQPPPFPVQSLCLSGDPVCGQGVTTNLAARLAAVATCLVGHCVHFDYAGTGPASATAVGGKFLETEAFG
jgi:hypothetical protein